MVFDGNIFRDVDAFYGDTHVHPELRDRDAQDFLETYHNFASDAQDVVKDDLEESLKDQAERLGKTKPELLQLIQGHVAINDVLRSDTAWRGEVA